MAIHFILQGKGGVGKTLTSTILAQYLLSKGKKVQCIDTDPVNQSFALYKGLKVKHFDILVDGNVNQSVFDDLIEMLLENKKDDFVIDNGASTFIPLTQYLIENEVIPFLQGEGIEVYCHSVLTGGESTKDTVLGLNTLIQNMATAKIVAWLNEFFGPVESSGKKFQQMKIYTDNKERIEGVILIPKKSELFSDDVKNMLTAKLTFDEANASKDFRVMAKSRLKKLKEIIFLNLDNVLAQQGKDE